MKKNLLFAICLFTVGSLSFSSCSDDKDTTKPTIANVEPHDGDTLKIGGFVHFEADFSDNESLKSYKIDIHDNFDGHGNHTKSTKAVTDSVAFAFNKIWNDIAGQKNAQAHHHEIEIPATDKNGKPYKEGKYHFIIYCLDTAGNESIFASNVVLSYTGSTEETEH